MGERAFGRNNQDKHNIELQFPKETRIERLTSSDWFGINQPNKDDTYIPNDFSFHGSSAAEENLSTSALTIAGFHVSESSSMTSSYNYQSNSPTLGNVHKYITPGNLDVLLGRGGLTNNHPGNVRYRELTEEWKCFYIDQRTKDDKKKVSELLMERVHDYGGRFLMKETESGCWTIADPKQARKKCSQALRESKWKRRKPCKSKSIDLGPS